jgi:integrase
LPVGTYGEISCARIGPSRYKARARYRRSDGKVVPVARIGQTKGEATRRLKEALTEEQTAGAAITGRTRISDLAERWYAEDVADDLSSGTQRIYRVALDAWILPRIGDLRISEAHTGRVDAVLGAVRLEHGASAAKTARAVLNGMFGVAVRNGALYVNPVRETRPIQIPRKQARALTVEQTDELCDKMRSDPRCLELDLPDLIEWGLATGCRIGEALALRDGFNEDAERLLDLDAGTWEVNATVVRLPGVGLVIQERPKTAAGHRVLALPGYAVDMLRRRRGELRFNPPSVAVLNPATGAIRREALWLAFAAPLRGSIRDPSNAAGDIREARARVGFEWITYHTLRKTVATRLDEAGLTPREVADQLGHANPSMTLDVYMGRRVVSARVAEALDR